MNLNSPYARSIGAAALVVCVAASLLLSPLATGSADAAINRVARVTKVVDGDTIEVVFPDRSKATVRLMGADTPEVGIVRGGKRITPDMCGSRAASAFSKKLLMAGDYKVTLSTDVAGATAPDGWRLLRRISAVRGGVRKDLSAELLKQGLAFYMPNIKQPTNETLYHRVADTAARRQLGVFKPGACGASTANFQMDLQWDNDAAGSVVSSRRSDPKLQEHVRITNTNAYAVDLTGWILRTGALRAERIDAPADGGDRLLQPGETMTIYPGSGTDTRLHRFLDYRGLMWVDIDSWARAPQYKGGEGAYLLDKAGAVHGYQMYGCVYNCSSMPGKGLKVTLIDWDMDGADGVGHNSEFVRVQNVSAATVNAGRTVVQIDSFTVELQPQLLLKPGEFITVYSGQPYDGHDPRTEYFLSASYGPLSQETAGGDRVLLRSYDGRWVHCGKYGSTNWTGCSAEGVATAR